MAQSGQNPQGDFYKNLNQLGDDCQSRLNSVSKNLTNGTSQLEALLKNNAVDNLKPTLETLNQSKQQALDAVNKYFAVLERQIKTNDSDQVPRQDLEKKAEKIFAKIAERQKALNDLSRDLTVREKCLDAMKLIRETNFEEENQRIQREIDDCQSLLRGNSTKLVKDDKALQGLDPLLEKFVHIEDPRNPNIKPQETKAPVPAINQGIQQGIQQGLQQGPKASQLSQREIQDEWDRNTRRPERNPFQSSPTKYAAEGPNSSSLILERQEQSPLRSSSPFKQKVSPKREEPFYPELHSGTDRNKGFNPHDYGSSPHKYENRDHFAGTRRFESPFSSKKLENPTKPKEGSPDKKSLIATENSFDPKTSGPYLHFFQDNSKKLHILDLRKAEKSGEFRFEEIDLRINFKIPVWHRSIITRQGTIYLTGGSDPEAEQKNFSDVYSYDPIDKTLRPHSIMNFARNSHGICVLQNYLYVVGGCLKKGGYSTSCERVEVGHYYNKSMVGWRNVASLKKPTCAPCVTSFNDTHIYKFGGYLDLTKMNETIERYDPRDDVWTEISYKLFGVKESQFSLMAYASCVQLNEEEILIFGGSNFEKKNDQVCIYRPGLKEQSIHKLDQFLPERGTFWNNALVFNGRVYGLQNIQLNADAYFLNKRRIICNNGKRWEQLNKQTF